MSKNKSYILLTHKVESCYDVPTQSQSYITTYKEYYKLIRYIKRQPSVISYEETFNGFKYSTTSHGYTLTFNPAVDYTMFDKSVLFKSI